jgi:hypothetical protein
MRNEVRQRSVAAKKTVSVFIILILFSCNHIQNGQSLSQHDIVYIKSLNLLDEGEQIYRFYSNYTKRNAGNFFSDKRIAEYWIDNLHKDRIKTSFAFYPDIQSIDTVYFAGATYCPYMLVTKKDNSNFKIYVDGSRGQVKLFFEDALIQWHLHKR